VRIASMFKIRQKVLTTKESDLEAGLPGIIIEIDEDDDDCPYYVELTDEDGDLVTEWCYSYEVEADGEVIE
jgi:hypothetical protein